jgi:hypothetical protein
VKTNKDNGGVGENCTGPSDNPETCPLPLVGGCAAGTTCADNNIDYGAYKPGEGSTADSNLK